MTNSEPRKPMTSRVLMNWFWGGYLRQSTPTLLGAMVFMVLEGLTLGALSYMIKPMFDTILTSGSTSSITWVAFAIMGVFVVRALSSFVQRVLITMAQQHTSARVQTSLVKHILTLDGPFFHQYPPGILIERTRGDSQQISQLWGNLFTSLGRDLVGVISLLAVALYTDWLWTLIVLSAAPLLVMPIAALQNVVRRTSYQAREFSSQVSNRLDEVFHGTTSIKFSGTEERETGRFESTISSFVRSELRSVRGQAAIPSLVDIVAGIGFCAVLYYGGGQIISGEKTIGEFMSFFTAIGLVIDPARRLGTALGTWQQAMAPVERLYEIFMHRPTIISPAVPKQLDMPAGQADIVLKDIVFSYTDSPVLQGTTFTAKAGQTTALVGASGAGKSTIFSLLTRLADAQSGSITLGDVQNTDLDLAELRGLYSVVSQDSLLFDETLRDNITMGQKVSDADLKAAMDAAHVTDFINDLDKGLDTMAGPRGSALSGGQRQRVAIARAILRNRPILLLDEATSALDAQSEKVVQEALEKLSQNRTTLVIAHRLSTIRSADKIVVMDQGRVVDQGSHDELLSRGGLYADLYRLQYSEGKTITDNRGVAARDRRRSNTETAATGSGPLGAASRWIGSALGLFGRKAD
ncbi:ABC-type multidrug transport system fused ATPase/permease subunit [Pacificibacter maritimus]|uniref:ABC-type multidrug transport system fused ATPase/permease subunit n=1 Tax=Pacificibacter maritimus TaxID=762213 RepID=A0A3N4V1M5_9RHOB|nr:ABC-type multidrug transport system fused ATPase/permease subunit [Pacificibacter maritimus]